MTVGFDIDNTMTNTKEMANFYYKNYEFKGEGDSYTKMPEEERRKFLDIYLFDISKNATLKEGVLETFEYLKNKGHRIVLITKRGHEEPKEVEDITIKYLKENNVEYDAIYFSCTNKGEICLKEDVKLFVDDHRFNLESVDEVGVIPLLFGYKESNKEYDYVTNWKDLLEYLIQKGF